MSRLIEILNVETSELDKNGRLVFTPPEPAIPADPHPISRLPRHATGMDRHDHKSKPPGP